ncbi:hypothetical protein LshimejAT787_0411690 [Lyophyllum shimeji]|uniref:Uncharacterized protein n=1 Tax=Lyophyllum shimeji TaxID=47721 RepID=A0A9P3PME6_LYOSH|nr:hypothetical protein LshimejAT787_0411690 [Lyophyllum shimeji]
MELPAAVEPRLGLVSITPDPRITVITTAVLLSAVQLLKPLSPASTYLGAALLVMATFTFSSKDILNSELHCAAAGRPPVSYTIHTTTGFLGRKTTSLVLFAGSTSRYQGATAAIHWKKHTFEIGGVSRDWADLKQHAGGIFSRKRIWRWSGQSYTVKFHYPIWTATSNSAQRPTTTTFTLYNFHWFRASEPAYISFPPDISEEDTVFLILVLLYSERKRQDRQRSSSNGGVIAGAGAGGGGGGGGC